MSESSTRTGGIGFCSALFLLFLALRLTDQIDWAWYWVAAPLWMPLGLVVAIFVGGAVLWFAIGKPIAAVVDWRWRRRRLARQYRAQQERESSKRASAS